MNQTISGNYLILLNDEVVYPNIPVDLVKHVEILLKIERKSRLLEALTAFPELTVSAINSMFELAALATGLNANELLRRTDFNPRDTDSIRIEAAFAEIRSINYLHDEGFKNIRIVRGSRSIRSADIIAHRDGYDYAVEVATSIYNAKHRFSREELKEWLLNRIVGEQKSKQLSTTAATLNKPRRLFIGVVDTANVVALQTYDELYTAIELTWQQLKASGHDADTLHISLLTGRETLGVGSDNCIFPALPISNIQA